MTNLSLFSYYYGILATIMLCLSIYTMSITENVSHVKVFKYVNSAEKHSRPVRKDEGNDTETHHENQTLKAQKENNTGSEQAENKTNEVTEEKGYAHSLLIMSNQSLMDHVQWWGNAEERRRKYPETENPEFEKRVYVAYGQCISRWPILYHKHIAKVSNLDVIILAYIEMLRVHCKDHILEMYMNLFEKGYARIQMDNSITYSNQTSLFNKPNLSFSDMDDLENLIELSAFTQVYVSWSRFPVYPVDPMGNEIKDSCFIEVVARLHAIDLTMVVAKIHTGMIAYLMGVKLKLVIKMMHVEFKGIKGHDTKTNHRRIVSKRCLVVTMALAQFLFRKSQSLINHRGCAHDAFQEFYRKKENMYLDVVEKYGRKPSWNLKKHGNASTEEFDSKNQKVHGKDNSKDQNVDKALGNNNNDKGGDGDIESKDADVDSKETVNNDEGNEDVKDSNEQNKDII